VRITTPWRFRVKGSEPGTPQHRLSRRLAAKGSVAASTSRARARTSLRHMVWGVSDSLLIPAISIPWMKAGGFQEPLALCSVTDAG
jgi:hypothetical protein